MAEGSIPYNNLPDKGSGPNNAVSPPLDGSGSSAPGNASDSSGMSWKTKVAIGATVGTVAGVGLAVATPTIILPAIGFGAAGESLKLASRLVFNPSSSPLERGVCSLPLRALEQSDLYRQ